MLYRIRRFFRLAYGSVEVVVGALAIYGAMGRAPELVSDPTTFNLLPVQLAAGIYIVIRGFDNWAQSAPFAELGSSLWARGS